MLLMHLSYHKPVGGLTCNCNVLKVLNFKTQHHRVKSIEHPDSSEYNPHPPITARLSRHRARMHTPCPAPPAITSSVAFIHLWAGHASE